MTLSIGIAGASGYVGGELLRLLLPHPNVDVVQVTAGRNVGRYVHQVHPHLRSQTNLRFSSQEELVPCDVLFLALPHGQAQTEIDRFANLADRLIDLSADFRLNNAEQYEATYGHPHQSPEWLSRFVYGLPEINREQIASAKTVSGVGCNATATTLALLPVLQSGLADGTQPIHVDLKVGSSEAGRTPTASSHHPERQGIVRPFSLTGHRHEAEVQQAYAYSGDYDIRMSITSVDLVRGVAAAVHTSLEPGLSDRDLWKMYRAAYQDEPFIRIVHEKGGLHRHPQPSVLAGTNFADVGWAYDPNTGRTVLLSAMDNLGKGAAGTAVQCMNLMCGFAETTGLDFGGIYP